MKAQLLLILSVLGLWAVYVCSYVVEETDQVIITQFGKPVGEPVTEAGLYFKLPLFRRLIVLKNVFYLGMVPQMKCLLRIKLI